MGAIRTLTTNLVLRATDAVKGLKAYDKLWRSVEKSVAASASAIERSSDRAVASLLRMANAGELAQVAVGRARGGGGGGGGSGGGGGGGGARSSEAAARRAAEQGRRNEERLARQTEKAEQAAARDAERRQRQMEREAAARTRRPRGGAGGGDPLDSIVAQGKRAGAASGGLADGAKTINEATAALGRFATAEERARAKVADLTAQVQRNREEMARLRRQAVETGDAEGTLAARMRGLAAETGIASQKLAGARRELRSFEGGLIAAIKKASVGKITIQALGTAIGNLASGAVTGALHGIAGALGESAKMAMNFEKAGVDIRKVARGADDTDEGFAKIQARIKETSKTLGVMPQEVAELTAALAPVFSGMQEKDTGAIVDLGQLSEDVTKIGKAWDVTGAEAGKFFADTSRGLGTTTTETKALFGSINELGNQLGVKSKDIAEAMTRSAGVIKASGLSGETGAALNATLIAAGASADVAATGVRTFVARLEAGTAATDKQRHAFQGLGLDAVEVGKQMSKGGGIAEKQILAVVTAIGKLPKEKQLPTLIELFGSESIGSIGAAATAVDTLGKAFTIAGDKGRALVSVEEEFKRVSNTTASRVDALKANIGVLAIEFGEALLPQIDKVVEFLTSPEGKEWGKNAVENLTGAVVGAVTIVSELVTFFGALSEKIGGAENAITLMGVAILALLGPIGVVTAALVSMIALNAKAEEASSEMQAALDAGYGPGLANDAGGVAENLAAYRAHKAKAGLSKLTNSDDEYERQQSQGSMGTYGGRSGMLGEAQERGGIVPMSTGKPKPTGAPPAVGAVSTPVADAADKAAGMDRFNELVRMRNADPDGLDPAEAKELRSLSKSLNRAIPKKPGKGRTHKQTKMDRQLAAIDPSVRAVLTGGGEKDKGGDLKVHDDPLSRAVYDRQNKANGLGGSSGGLGSVGPGPNITNHYTYVTTNVDMDIDARGNGDAATNLAASATEVATRVGEVRFTGANRIIGQRNMGGVRRGPA